MKKWINWLCPAVFLLVIFAGAVLFFALPRQDYSVLEKRYLQETPEITLKTLEDGTVLMVMCEDSDQVLDTIKTAIEAGT